MRRRWVHAVVWPVLLLGACQGGQGGDSASTQGGGMEAADEHVEPADEQLAPGQAPPPEAAGLPELGPAVIKDATLDVEVETGAFGDAVNRATAVASRYGGYVLSSTVEGEDAKRGTLVMRVPADRFEEAIAELRAIGEPQQQSITGKEVGQQFVDLEARLQNARAQQGVLLRLMNDAVSIADTIRVQRELEGVQLEIEELTGRLRFLRDRTALGTIAVNITEVGAPAAPGVFARAWGRAVDVFLGIAYVVIVGAAFVIPLGLIAGLGFVVYRRVRARLQAA